MPHASFLELRRRLRRYAALLTLIALIGCSPTGRVSAVRMAARVPTVTATATWPAGDVPSLLGYEMARFEDLSGRAVNVKHYGAQGDGSTDDTAAVQAAIAVANGGTLWFPPGTYIVDSVQLPAGAKIRLLGAGQGVTTLEHATTSQGSMIVGSPQVVTQFEAENLTLDGNVNPRRAAGISEIELQADRVLLQHIEAKHSGQQAIRLRSTTYTSIIRDSWLHDFQLHGPTLNTDTRAVQIDHDVVSDGDVWLIDNTVEMTPAPTGAGNSAGGFRSSGLANTRLFIWKNVFRNMGQDWPQEYLAPIDIYRDGDGSVIWQNQVYDSYYTPIRVMRSNDVQVVDNVIDGEGHIGPEWGGGINFQGREPDVNMHGAVIRDNTIRNVPDAQAITGWFDADGVMSDITIDGNNIDHARGAVYLEHVRGQVRVTNTTASNYSSGLQGIASSDASATQLIDCGNPWSSTACGG